MKIDKRRHTVKQAEGYANGRVVLVGEHSVVYGEPALVSSIDLGVRVRVRDRDRDREERSNGYLGMFMGVFEEKTGKSMDGVGLEIESDLPQKRGLSSSSALACSMYRALGEWFGMRLSDEELLELVLAAERKIYPVSGMDQTAVVYGGVFRFQKKDKKLVREEVPTKALEGVKLVLVDTGKPRESTAEMVAQVNKRASEPGSKYKRIIRKMGEVAEEFIDRVKEGRFKPELIRENERLLEELGVVGRKAREMVREIEELGGVAKISGAGGVKSGSGYLVCWHEDGSRLIDLTDGNNWTYHVISVGS